MPDFSKIKINNAIVVYMLVLACVFFPVTTMLLLDYKVLYNPDLIKITIATICVGSSQFGFTYIIFAFLASIKRRHEWSDEKVISDILRYPLFSSVLILTIQYTFIFFENFPKAKSLEENLIIVRYFVIGMVVNFVASFCNFIYQSIKSGVKKK